MGCFFDCNGEIFYMCFLEMDVMLEIEYCVNDECVGIMVECLDGCGKD